MYDKTKWKHTNKNIVICSLKTNQQMGQSEAFRKYIFFSLYEVRNFRGGPAMSECVGVDEASN